MAHLLEVRNLKTYFHTDAGIVKAVDGISYHLDEKEIVGLVGESGCGKSVSQLSTMQLVPTPPGEIVSGEVFFEGKDILRYKPNSPDIRDVRGNRISFIFQEPMTSLNPVLKISQQLTETLETSQHLHKKEAQKRGIELLRLVGIPDPEDRYNHYPHQFSGGMRQRIMIAMALSCKPRVLIADEPTTALDVTTQAQLLEVMRDMVTRFNTALTIVTHNLGVVARYAWRLYVMYAGRIVEAGTSKEIFGDCRHPYTKGLLASVPRLDEVRRGRLVPIKGLPPNLVNMPPTCAFLPRCPYKIDRCKKEDWPELRHIAGQHYVACYVDVREKNVGPC